METYKGYPAYDAVLDDDKFRAGVGVWAFVKKPATHEALFRFSQDDQGDLANINLHFDFDHINKDKRIITTIGMLADTYIFREMKFGDEVKKFYMRFPPDVVERMAFKFMKDQHTKNINREHNAGDTINDVYVVETYLNDQSRGIQMPPYLSHATHGSWILSFKIDDDQLMDDIDMGKVNGISLEGEFGLKLNFGKTFVELDKSIILDKNISVSDKFKAIQTVVNENR